MKICSLIASTEFDKKNDEKIQTPLNYGAFSSFTTDSYFSGLVL